VTNHAIKTEESGLGYGQRKPLVGNQLLKWARVRCRQDSTIIHKVRAFMTRLIVPLRTRATPTTAR
jgi:hypothetical protein